MPFALAPIAAVPARVVTSSRVRVASRAPLVATRPVHRGTIHKGRGRISTTPRASLMDPVAVNDALFQLAANANELVDGCGVNGTCGQVSAPPFALIGSALLIGGGFLAFVTFGMKGGADAAAEMQDRDKDFFSKK